MKKISFLLLSMILILSLAFGCAKSSSDVANGYSKPGVVTDEATGGSAPAEPAPDMDGNYGETTTEESGQDKNATVDTGVITADPSRKMIWNGETQLETTDFDLAVSALYSLIEECGGYIQSSAVTGEGRNELGEPRLRNARYTVRIPGENFQLFMKSSGNVATIIYSNTGAEDVTASYFDTEARVKVLKIKEDRLIEMLENTKNAAYADQLQYILQIENELSNVRYEIESLTGTLKRYDDLISYSTVTVYLNEVKKLTATPIEPKTVGQRIAARFESSLTGVIEAGGTFLVWFIGSSPVLIILGILVVIIFFSVRKINKRDKKRKLPPPLFDNNQNPPPSL